MLASWAHRDTTEAARFRSAVAMTLRELPGDMLRELATRWPANGNLAERIVAEAIVEHLELCGSRLEHRPKPTAGAMMG